VRFALAGHHGTISESARLVCLTAHRHPEARVV
jgi:hypothetical protein